MPLEFEKKSQSNIVKWEIFASSNFRVISRVSREARKLKSAKYFPSLTNHLFTCIQNNNCVFICVSIDQRSLNVNLHAYTFY